MKDINFVPQRHKNLLKGIIYSLADAKPNHLDIMTFSEFSVLTVFAVQYVVSLVRRSTGHIHKITIWRWIVISIKTQIW